MDTDKNKSLFYKVSGINIIKADRNSLMLLGMGGNVRPDERD